MGQTLYVRDKLFHSPAQLCPGLEQEVGLACQGAGSERTHSSAGFNSSGEGAWQLQSGWAETPEGLGGAGSQHTLQPRISVRQMDSSPGPPQLCARPRTNTLNLLTFLHMCDVFP